MSSIGPVRSSARIAATIGVSISPGATAFSRTPAPAHSGVVACARTQYATAIFVAAYAPIDVPSSATAAAAASSPSRHAFVSASGMSGCTVVEFELMATAAPPPAASNGRRPSSTSTVPK